MLSVKLTRKSYDVSGVFVPDDDMVTLHRLAAWILENGGRAWIKDGYESQGPDILHLRDKDSHDVIVRPDSWVVFHPGVGFKVMTDEEVQVKFDKG